MRNPLRFLKVEKGQKPKFYQRKLFLIPIAFAFIFFLVTGTIYAANYVIGSGSHNAINNALSSDTHRHAVTNSTDGEVLYYDSSGNIQGRGNVTFNYSTGGYGYFKWLGDSVNKITKGWFTNLQVDQNINATNATVKDVIATGNLNGSSVYSGGSLTWTESGLVNLSQLTNDVPYAVNSSLGNYYLKTNPFGFYNSTNFVISDYVPYTGASSNLDLGTHNLTIGSTALFVNGNTGNVGIGTTSPSNALEVSSATQFKGITISGNTDPIFNITSSSGYSYGMVTRSDNKLGIGKISDIVSGSPALIIDTNGNVGIGTTSPQNKLNVVGDLNVTGTIYGTVSGSTIWNRSSTNVYLANTGDSVGIGTTSPTAQLVVQGTTSTYFGGRNGFVLNNTNSAGGQSNSIGFDSAGGLKWGIGTDWAANGGNNFYINPSGSVTPVIYLTNTSKVGIGTTTPQNKLNVAGDANVTGTIYLNSASTKITSNSTCTKIYGSSSELDVC